MFLIIQTFFGIEVYINFIEKVKLIKKNGKKIIQGVPIKCIGLYCLNDLNTNNYCFQESFIIQISVNKI